MAVMVVMVRAGTTVRAASVVVVPVAKLVSPE